VISLTSSLQLDDHVSTDIRDLGVQTLPADLHPRDNLALQTDIVAGASAFVGTYGGVSYLAPFLGVRATAYYSDPNGYSQRHLLMARSALRSIGHEALLSVQPAHATLSPALGIRDPGSAEAESRVPNPGSRPIHTDTHK
jgi:hypothetical protein